MELGSQFCANVPLSNYLLVDCYSCVHCCVLCWQNMPVSLMHC